VLECCLIRGVVRLSPFDGFFNLIDSFLQARTLAWRRLVVPLMMQELLTS
jgi:hypothetical protein